MAVQCLTVYSLLSGSNQSSSGLTYFLLTSSKLFFILILSAFFWTVWRNLNPEDLGEADEYAQRDFERKICLSIEPYKWYVCFFHYIFFGTRRIVIFVENPNSDRAGKAVSEPWLLEPKVHRCLNFSACNWQWHPSWNLQFTDFAIRSTCCFTVLISLVALLY